MRSIPDQDSSLDFETWYAVEMPRIFRYVFYRTRDHTLAEEVTAAACEKAIAYLHNYDPVRGRFEAWLFGIARNELRQRLRAEKRGPQWLSLDQMPPLRILSRPAEDELLLAEQFAAVLNAIAQLPPRQQEVMALRYGVGLGHAEIGQVLGLSANHTGVLLHRALKRIRAILQELGELAR